MNTPEVSEIYSEGLRKAFNAVFSALKGGEISRMPPKFFDEMKKIFEAGEKKFRQAKGSQKGGPIESLSELSESQFATSKALDWGINASCHTHSYCCRSKDVCLLSI